MTDAPLLLGSQIPSEWKIRDLAVVELRGQPLVVCVDFMGGVWTWDPLADGWQKRPLAYAFAGDPLAAQYPDADENDIDVVAAAVVNGHVILAAGGDEQGPALWDLDSGELLRGAMYNDPYLTAAAVVQDESPPRFVTGSIYGPILVWDASGDTPPVTMAEYDVSSIAAARVDGRTLVAAGFQSIVDVWDLAGNDEEVASFEMCCTETSSVSAISFARLDDCPVVVAACETEVHVWKLSGGDDEDPVHGGIAGHEDEILALDTATVSDRCIAVTGAKDETVRIWDLAEGAEICAPLAGHQGGVEAVRTAVLGGREVALSAGRDGVIRVWDLAALVK